MIGAFISLILLSTVLVTASTKGWWFGLNKNNGEHVAARIQVNHTSSDTLGAKFYTLLSHLFLKDQTLYDFFNKNLPLGT